MPVYLTRHTRVTTVDGQTDQPIGYLEAQAAGVPVPGDPFNRPWIKLDLRNRNQETGALLGGQASGWCLFRSGAPVPEASSTIYLADGLDDVVEENRLIGIATRLDITLTSPMTVRSLLIDLMVNQAGLGRWRPLPPNTTVIYFPEPISING